jgi:dTDP-3-amino-2,3,6-trideoxy-4-keto-D-glucose/dTDP-3-amino-3,4,6-trideoxy-alpha-D-glucose/dTDP-2,6-dideoxy-D-kanosamine transaminase
MLINNLSAHLASQRVLVDKAIKRVLDRGWFVLGPELENFEKCFASYNKVAHCIGVANGTDAIELVLRALGVKAGDQVASAANAGMYTTTAIFAIGATPVFMDVDLTTHLVKPSEVERVISMRVKAVVVTHLYGQAIIDIAEIAIACRTANIKLVEDCAQAHGARIDGNFVGSFGDAGCFSFYPTKNLGALGDGGAVVCFDNKLAEKVKYLRQYGWTSKYHVKFAGSRNSRLDEIQAAILSEFLPYLEGWNTRRREIASQYSRFITHPAIMLPLEKGEDYVAHLYVVRAVDRGSLRQHLLTHNIASDIHYPIPDHRQAVFEKRFFEVHLPKTELLSQEVLTLPCYPEMVQSDIEKVINAVNYWPIAAIGKGNT